MAATMLLLEARVPGMMMKMKLEWNGARAGGRDEYVPDKKIQISTI